MKSVLHNVVASIFVFVLLAGGLHAQQTSVAEAAAKARADREAASAVMGRTVGGDYHNEVLGLEILHIPGWTSLSRGQMNVDEAIGRAASGMHVGIKGSAHRVFGMRDDAGSSVILTIDQVADNEIPDLNTVRSILMESTKKLPNAHVSEESMLLDDPSHHFIGVRVAWRAEGTNVFASRQILQLNGYGISLVISAPSAEKLEKALKELQSSVRWGSKQSSN